tara:strand:+ start:168 stop:1067 length:900 start_codon:yes stop_codon:yes gene_type:complete
MADDASLYHALAKPHLRARLRPFWESVVARPSQCVPDATVVVTAVNAAHMELLQLQSASVPPCFLRRYGALCFSEAGAARGGEVVASNVSCMHWPVAALAQRLSYDVFTWLKWEVLHLALLARGVSGALWLDVDVAILRNPFALLASSASAAAPPRQSGPPPPPPPPDLTHQFNGLHSDLNTGVMMLRSEPLVRHVLAASRWWEVRHKDIEQVVVQRLLAATNFSTRGLAYSAFASYCWLRVRDDEPPSGYALSLLCRPSLLHANCLQAVADKRAAMRGAVAAFRRRCGVPRFHRARSA